MREEGYRHDDEIADRIGDYVRHELTSDKDDAEPQRRIPDANQQKAAKNGVYHRGFRSNQHCVQSNPDSDVPRSAPASHLQIFMPRSPQNSPMTGR